MEAEHFTRLVAAAVESLPPEFLTRLENIEVVVEDEPSDEQLESVGMDPEESLLGLYEGVPLTSRTSYYGMVLPDKVTIFQLPIEEICRTDNEIVYQIRETVRHEIAHHFGISDARLDELKRNRRRKR